MKQLTFLLFALLLTNGSLACSKGAGEEEGGKEGTQEEGAEESGEEGEAEAEEEDTPAPEIDTALVGHWAQGSGDIVTFNSRGRVHMGSSGCVGTYTAANGVIQTTFDNAGPNCQGSRLGYSIEGETMTWITRWTRQDSEDDTSI